MEIGGGPPHDTCCFVSGSVCQLYPCFPSAYTHPILHFQTPSFSFLLSTSCVLFVSLPMLEYLSLSSNFPLYNFFSSQTESVHAGGVTCTSTTTSCCGKYFVGLAVFSSKLIYKCVFLSLCVSCFRPKPRTLFKPGTM